MLQKRALLAKILASGPASRVVRKIPGIPRPEVISLAYHKVLPRTPVETYPYDLELVSAWDDEFDWQMRYLAENFAVVSAKDVIDATNGVRALPPRAAMVTFDDGFFDNYSVAFPILRKYSIPAIFFLVTDIVDTRKMYWFDWVAFSINSTRSKELYLPSLSIRETLAADIESRRDCAARILHVLKTIPDQMRRAALGEIASSLGVAADSAPDDHAYSMSWQNVKEMQSAGMNFGSHTATHPVLSKVATPELLEFEFGESKAKLEAMLGQEVTSLAYPVGGKDAVDERAIHHLKQFGYQIAFTYQRGANFELDPNERFALKRIAVERYIDKSLFRAMIELPHLFSR